MECKLFNWVINVEKENHVVSRWIRQATRKTGGDDTKSVSITVEMVYRMTDEPFCANLD
jgi:hypothetical protein